MTHSCLTESHEVLVYERSYRTWYFWLILVVPKLCDVLYYDLDQKSTD